MNINKLLHPITKLGVVCDETVWVAEGYFARTVRAIVARLFPFDSSLRANFADPSWKFFHISGRDLSAKVSANKPNLFICGLLHSPSHFTLLY